jgi:hypothetical protein
VLGRPNTDALFLPTIFTSDHIAAQLALIANRANMEIGYHLIYKTITFLYLNFLLLIRDLTSIPPKLIGFCRGRI